jgi:hypothetical protein
VTPATRPKWIDDPLAAAIGRIVMLEERVAECERQREQIERQESRIRFLEERLAQLTRPRELLTENEAAAELRVSLRTMRNWRSEKPARISFILLEGGDIRYRAKEIENYLKSRERGNPTVKKGIT